MLRLLLHGVCYVCLRLRLTSRPIGCEPAALPSPHRPAFGLPCWAASWAASPTPMRRCPLPPHHHHPLEQCFGSHRGPSQHYSRRGCTPCSRQDKPVLHYTDKAQIYVPRCPSTSAAQERTDGTTHTQDFTDTYTLPSAQRINVERAFNSLINVIKVPVAGSLNKINTKAVHPILHQKKKQSTWSTATPHMLMAAPSDHLATNKQGLEISLQNVMPAKANIIIA